VCASPSLNMAPDTVTPIALLFAAWFCFADCMDLNSTQGMLEQEHQQLLQVRTQLPAFSTASSFIPAKGLSGERFPVLSKLVAEVFDGTVVICYKERCNDHKPGSYIWPPLALNKIIALDGDLVDKQFFQNDACQDSYICHMPKTTVTHLVAVQMASERGWKNVLILEDDIQETGVVANQAEFISAFKKLLSTRSWNGLKLSGRYFPWEPKCSGKCLLEAKCSSNCVCKSVPEWNKSDDLSICESVVVPPSSDYKLSTKDAYKTHCKIFSSSAYALHASGFGPFLAMLEDVKNSGGPGSPAYEELSEALLIDRFVMANVPMMLHVLPLIAVQYEDDSHLALTFKSYCNV